MQWFEMAGLSVMIIVGFGSVVAIAMRWFRHRERLAMIRQGLIPDDAGAPARAGTRKRHGLLFGGLSIAALGALLLCAAFWVAVPTVTTAPTAAGLSSVGLIPLPGLLVAFMGVGLLILYVWAQPTVERRRRAPAAGPVADAELEVYEPEIDPAASWEAPAPADLAAPGGTPATGGASTSTLDAKAPIED